MTSLDPRLSAIRRAATWPVVVGLIVLAIGVLLALAGRHERGFLDPDAIDSAGSRALARLLTDQGITVIEAQRTDDAVRAITPQTTLLVITPDLLHPEQAARLAATGADLVLVAPGSTTGFAPGVEVAGQTGVGRREPGCALTAAQRAGPALTGGLLYRSVAPDAQRCYPADDGAALLVVRLEDHTVTMVGTPVLFTNEHLAEEGNAALAMGLLGGNQRLVWYRPSLADFPAGQRSLNELLPRWVFPVVVQLFVAVALLALWRGRRLGPVVPEPLPVVVRAAETVEGRARLYRRASARDSAAAALRAAAAARIGARLGLPRGAPSSALVAAIAERLGRPAAELDSLFRGPVPADDAALVRLAENLDAVEQEVRRT